MVAKGKELFLRIANILAPVFDSGKSASFIMDEDRVIIYIYKNTNLTELFYSNCFYYNYDLESKLNVLEEFIKKL